MIKKILKKTILVTSVLISGAAGFLINNDETNNQNPGLLALQEPIFSIDIAYADGSGGDCCCGCDTSYYPPIVDDAGVYIDVVSY